MVGGGGGGRSALLLAVSRRADIYIRHFRAPGGKDCAVGGQTKGGADPHGVVGDVGMGIVFRQGQSGRPSVCPSLCTTQTVAVLGYSSCANTAQVNVAWRSVLHPVASEWFLNPLGISGGEYKHPKK